MTPCFHPSSQDQPAPNKAGWRVRVNVVAFALLVVCIVTGCLYWAVVQGAWDAAHR